MTDQNKLQLNDRLEIALTILVNIKEDFKLLAERNKGIDGKEELLNIFLAKMACDAAIAVSELKEAVLKPEHAYRNFIEKNVKGE